jgi:hypothetical protein
MSLQGLGGQNRHHQNQRRKSINTKEDRWKKRKRIEKSRGGKGGLKEEEKEKKANLS